MFRPAPAIWLLLGTTLATGLGVGYALGQQPHMQAAIGFLQNARGELQAATPNKGGHRITAMA